MELEVEVEKEVEEKKEEKGGRGVITTPVRTYFWTPRDAARD